MTALPRATATRPLAASPPALPILLFAPTPEALEWYRRRLPLAATVIGTGSWTVVESLAPVAECVVLAVPRWSTVTATEALVSLRARWPGLATVYLGARASDRRDVRRARAAHSALRATVAVPALWAAVQGACTRLLLTSTAQRVRESYGPGVLAAALTQLVEGEPPPTSVADLCAAAGVHRHTLWYKWSRRVRGPALRLEDVVNWVLLLRASLLCTRGVSWSVAASSLGVHRHTLARTARRSGLGAATLAIEGHPVLRAAFREKVLPELLRG